MNSANFIRTIAVMILNFAAFPLHAQQTVDIGLFQTAEKTLEVRLNPRSNFDGIVSNLAFTIRWNTDEAQGIVSFNQTSPEIAYVTMDKSGSAVQHSGFQYQIFAGFGMLPMSQLQTAWEMNREVVLMTLTIEGAPEAFELINDSWTDDVQNNGSYYASLGGLDKTGAIYQPKVEPSTNVTYADSMMIRLYPNPSKGVLMLDANFLVPGNYVIKISNALTKEVFRKELTGYSGKLSEMIDLSMYGNGVYLLTIEGEGMEHLEKVIKF